MISPRMKSRDKSRGAREAGALVAAEAGTVVVPVESGAVVAPAEAGAVAGVIITLIFVRVRILRANLPGPIPH